jgi:hypothetical protein
MPESPEAAAAAASAVEASQPAAVVEAALEEGVPLLPGYNSIRCKTLCRAAWFHERCGCAPFTHNVHGSE